MAYDNVNYKAFCPQCGGFLADWCTDDGTAPLLSTLEVWQVRDMRAVCAGCGADVVATVDAEVEHAVKRCDVRLMVRGQGSSAPSAAHAVSASEMMYERIKRDKSRQERLDAIVANLGSGMPLAEVMEAHKRDSKMWDAERWPPCLRETTTGTPYSDMRDAERWQWFIERGGVWPTDTGIKRPPAELIAMADRAMLAERNHGAP